MPRRIILPVFLVLTCLAVRPLRADNELPSIESVEIRNGRVFYINGQPFFPIMAWLQGPENFAAIRACGMNATAGYWPKSGGTRDVNEYLERVEKAGLYGVMPFDQRLKGHAALLGYIHDDEPDLPRRVSDAEVRPARQLRINKRTPLWKLVDGDTFSWSVLDPLAGAEVTIVRKEPVKASSVAIWLTVSKGLALARKVVFVGDDMELLQTTLAPKKGRQRFDLDRPATFKELTVRILEVTPGEQVWGSLGEIEAFDDAGQNVLLARPRNVSRQTPAATMEKYRMIKAHDAARPVFMTFTGYFHPFFKKYGDRELGMYPRFIQSADVVGYDIYPIYGWNKPEWIHLVHEGTDRLVKLAGNRPVYAWIETSKGGQYTGELSRQKDVTPTHIRAEVWMAICRGATAIGYFTHIWKPSYAQFGVPENNRRCLASLNAQITRLAPAILGARSKKTVVLVSGPVKVDALSKEHDGQLYIFAVNYDERRREAEVVFRVSGLPAASEVTVVDEQRTLRSERGHFTDRFAPLEVHIYHFDAGF